jgi:tRNA:m4X modification enzyme
MSHQEGLGKAARCRVHQITGTQVQSLLAKLRILETHLPNLTLHEILTSTDYNAGEANVSNQDKMGGKHVLQEVSIIGHLRRINAFNNNTTTAIELGAGTGRLSDRLQRITEAKLTHVLIDRQDFVHNQCRDRILRARCRSPERQIKRVVADIGSLKMHDYIDENTMSSSFCMSKHLCGPACDLAILSISRMAEQCPQPLPPAVIATCCHYLCTWESYIGKKFWLGLGLTREDFIVATTCSQWSTLQRKKKSAKSDTNNASSKILPDLMQIARSAKVVLDEMDAPTVEKHFLPSEEFEKKFAREEKAALGMLLKQLFDLSRAAFCQQHGYKVELVRYTTRSTEDRLLILR